MSHFAKTPRQTVSDDKAASPSPRVGEGRPAAKRGLSTVYTVLAIFVLFLNFFLAQYDKFVLSYFQEDVIDDLRLTSIDYGVISGYATSIAFAILALPVAFIADYTEARIWVLSVAAVWWSLCVFCQGLSHNFWQLLLARIGMGIGQAPVEALSISLISDLVEPRWLFLSESLFYISVYVGEAVSGQIATAFNKTGTPWNKALKAIGIVGIVLGVVTRILLREPERRYVTIPVVESSDPSIFKPIPRTKSRISHARSQIRASVSQIFRMRSFWILTLSSGARQFSGNVFGWYMPSYLSSIYTNEPDLLSRYGIIVGAVGSVAVALGGVICSLVGKERRVATALYLTGVGGMISAGFVVIMVFSLRLAHGNQNHGTGILYGSMSAAYITAELWLGAFASVLALIVPPRTKTFCLAIYTSTIILIYSSAPEMIGLSLRKYAVGSPAYIVKTREILAVLIPVGYWVGGIGFLIAIGKVRADMEGRTLAVASAQRRFAFLAFVLILGALTIALFAVSLTISGLQ